ncbi:MAG: tetratricopeptide repeat protein [Desulfobacterales bacterium]|nr:tetratricopeptide repeat protein [Desulfobacterales bacterium]
MSKPRSIRLSKTFKDSSAKKVLSSISRELGPDAVIIDHRKYRDPEGRLWHEATASPRLTVPTGKDSLEGRPKIFKRYRPRIYLVSAFAIIFLIIAAAWILRPPAREDPRNPSSEKLSIALMGFENQTGDASYDYLNEVIPNLLITRLEQSGLFDVASWEWLEDLRKYAGNDFRGTDDRKWILELCRKNRIDILVTGSFTMASSLFATDVKILEVKPGKLLGAASAKGNGVESLFESQIDELGAEISQGLGFPDRDEGGHSFRVADITTNSIDAYYHFLRGRECYSDENLKDARLFLEKAVQLDPGFAMAHFYLATSLNISGERKAAIEACEKALSLSSRATEKERLFIEGSSILILQKDLDESVRIFTEMKSRYPRDKDSHYGLGMALLYKSLYEPAIEELQKAIALDPYDGKVLGLIAIAYQKMGDYETSLAYWQRQIAASPKNGQARINMAYLYLDLGKLDEALTMCGDAFNADPDLIVSWVAPYVYALTEKYDEALQLVGRNVFLNPFLYFPLSIYHYWTGARREALDDLQRLIDYAASMGTRQSEANALWLTGWIAYDRGEFDLSRTTFKGWFDIYMQTVLPKRNNFADIRNYWTAWYTFYLGLVDVKEGNLESAKSGLEEIRSLLPDIPQEYQNWITYYACFLEAEVCLAEGEAEKAILVCKQSPPMGGWIMSVNCWLYNVPFLRDVLARAYRQKGDLSRAAAEYERLIHFKTRAEERNLVHPLYYFRLGEVKEEQGDRFDAVKNYERFLELWKNAAADIPEIIEAKTRLTRLRGET